MRVLRTALASPDLRRLLSGFLAVSLGNWAFSILLALYAYARAADRRGRAVVVRMLPAGLAAPYAAMLADRHARRSILLWSSVLRAAALLGAAATAAVGAPLGAVLIFATLFTIAGTAHRPAQAALMPQLARTPGELAAANVCWSAIDYAGFLLGSLLAGLLAGVIGLDVSFAVCAAAFAFTALVVRALPPDPRPRVARRADGRPGGAV